MQSWCASFTLNVGNTVVTEVCTMGTFNLVTRCSPFWLELKGSHWKYGVTVFHTVVTWSLQRRVFIASSLITHYKSWHQLHMYSSRCTIIVLLHIMPLKKNVWPFRRRRKKVRAHIYAHTICVLLLSSWQIVHMIHSSNAWSILQNLCALFYLFYTVHEDMCGIVFIAVLCTEC